MQIGSLFQHFKNIVMKKIFLFIILCLTLSMSAQRYLLPADTIKRYQFNNNATGQMLNYSDYLRSSILYQLTQGVPTIPTGTTTVTGSVSVTNTVSVSQTTATTTVTYSYVTSSGTNTVTAGARLVSICNTGSANANFNGTTLPAGACVTLPEVNGILKPQITYDCLTSALVVLIER